MERCDRTMRCLRLLSVISAVTLLACGCLTGSTGSRRLARWRPETEGISLTATTTSVAGVPTPVPVSVSGRVLQRGDKVTIHLRGIPHGEILPEEIDELGEVTLPHVGTVRIVDLSSGEAESRIEQTYKEMQIYKSINVIVMADTYEYFVRGEVRRQGRFPLTGPLTLMQAIATAGGYTEYARETRIRITRDGKRALYNGPRITKLKDEDPYIKAGDIIVVDRRWY